MRRNLILLIIVVCLALTALLGYTIFQVTEITVEGNNRFTSEQIIALSGIQLGDHLLMIRDGDIKQAIESEPYLTFVKLERNWPDKLVIHVAEKDAMAAIKAASGYALIYTDGTVLQKLETADNFILIEGVEATAAVPGKQVEGLEAYQKLCMERVLGALAENELGDLIASIDITMPVAIQMEAKCGITIQLGNTDYVETQMSWVKKLLPQLIREGKTGGTLDASGTTGASYIPE